LACVNYLARLGPYEFNTSTEKSMLFDNPQWVGPQDLCKRLNTLATLGTGGDIYARLPGPT
jgi:hypothetical protein